MLRKYRNKLLEVIKSEGWDASLFSGSDETIEDGTAFVIRLDCSPFQFIVRTCDENSLIMDCKYTLLARNYPLSKWFPDSGYYDYEGIEYSFKDWLKLVDEYIEEMKTLDLWTVLTDSLGTFDQKIMQSNTVFSVSEKDRISESLHKLLNEVQREQILNSMQMESLEEEVGYLIEASGRLGRKDWLNAAIGALFGYIIQAALTSETARTLSHLASEAIKWITHNPSFLNQ
jgi:hypothetical protein